MMTITATNLYRGQSGRVSQAWWNTMGYLYTQRIYLKMNIARIDNGESQQQQ